MKTAIKDFTGRILGYISTDSSGNKTVTDFYGRTLGYYRASDDTTRDFYNRIVARGDQVGMLIKG